MKRHVQGPSRQGKERAFIASLGSWEGTVNRAKASRGLCLCQEGSGGAFIFLLGSAVVIAHGPLVSNSI